MKAPRWLPEVVTASLAFLGLVAALSLCTACAEFPSSRKEIEAEGKYGSQQYNECVAPEPILGSRATREERIAAWDRVDACRARVRAKWGIAETITDAGADR